MNIKFCLVRVYVVIAFAIALSLMSFTSALAGTEMRQPSDGPLIPAMTSNTTPYGSVTRSGIYSSSYEAWKAFDGTTGNFWLSNLNTSSVWIGYEWGGGTTKVASSYEIKYANGSCCEQRGPKDWTLQGWNGATWDVVDTVTNQTGWYANGTRTHTVDTPGSYSQYRLNITADNYNNPTYPVTLVSIAEFQLYGAQQPAYYLKLNSISCYAKQDVAGYDEPRLYVNGVRVWSHDHFDKYQTASLTHIAPIPFGSNSSLPVTLQEYDAWPGSTVTIPAWNHPGAIDPTVGSGNIEFERDGFQTWYILDYTVVYE